MDFDDEVARVLERLDRALSAPFSHPKAVYTAMAHALRKSLEFVYQQGVAMGRAQLHDPTIALLRSELEQARRERDDVIAARWTGNSDFEQGDNYVRQ
jgi:hypothetical protein